MNQKKKEWYSLGIIILAIILCSTSALAFGVTAPHWKENPLRMNAGQSRELAFSLQNMVGDEDLSIKIELLKGREYLTHLDASTIYEVPAKTKGVKVNFKIDIPENARPGEIIPVEVYFVTTSTAGSGELALGIGVSKVFDIILSGAPQPLPQEAQIPTSEESRDEESKSRIRPLTKDDLIPALAIAIVVLIFWLILQRAKIGRLRRKQAKNANKRYAPW